MKNEVNVSFQLYIEQLKSNDSFVVRCERLENGVAVSRVFDFAFALKSVMPKTIHQNLLMCLSDAIVQRFNELLTLEERK